MTPSEYKAFHAHYAAFEHAMYYVVAPVFLFLFAVFFVVVIVKMIRG